jgi:hypothetical protein
MGRTLGSSGPGGGAAGEGEEHGVCGAHHGVAGDGELELPEQVGPEALAAHADTPWGRDGRAAALAARGGSRARDRGPAHPLFWSIIHGAPGGGTVGTAAGATASGGGGGGHGGCTSSS